MNDDYIASIVTINCLGTLTNMSINNQMLCKSKCDRTEELLEAILAQLKQLNERLDNGI